MRAHSILAALSLAMAASGCEDKAPREPAPAPVAVSDPQPEPPHYVGSETCAGCHAVEAAAWKGSQHERAMQAPDRDSVLAPFAGETFVRGAAELTFVRDPDGTFVVEERARPSAGEDTTTRWIVRYTFGVDPLQQVLVEGERGRLQALDVAWDTRSKADGGQRWFHVMASSGEAEAEADADALSWKGPAFTWNFMCADCHSTAVDKRYDFASDRYATHFEEVSVGCEACHGPGSKHAESRRGGGEERGYGAAVGVGEARAWRFEDGASIASLASPDAQAPHSAEVSTCAPCHAHRVDHGGVGLPFAQRYAMTLPAEPLYFADGQAREEVYVHGSFAQSKMAHAGVTCRDCHDPHSMTLKAEGDGTCASCHRTETYATAEHHFHPEQSAGARCVACHMPQRTFMGIDTRRDHRFSVPRPDLSRELGVPNTCETCHADRDPAWMEAAITTAHGPDRVDGPAERLARARRNRDAPALANLVTSSTTPDILRAAAFAALLRVDVEVARATLEVGGTHAVPSVRRALAEGVAAVPREEQGPLLIQLFGDPDRMVRLAARHASAWAPIPGAPPPAPDEELAIAHHLDRPEGIIASANRVAAGDPAMAESLLRTGVERWPGTSGMRVNLADLLRASGREAEAETLLREAVVAHPNDAHVHQALGLSLVRQGRYDDAIASFERARDIEPSDVDVGFVLAIALHDRGRTDAAIAELGRLRELAPLDVRIDEAMTAFAADAPSNPDAPAP